MSSTSIGRPQRLTPGLMASGLGLDDRQLMVPKSQGQPTVWMVLKPCKTLVNHGRNYLFLNWCLAAGFLVAINRICLNYEFVKTKKTL